MYPIKYFLNTDYEEMEVLGVTGLFSNLRIDEKSLPPGFYKYSFRESDSEYFATLETNVFVNHSGDFICKTPLDLGEDDWKELDEDYGFTDNKVDLNKFFNVDILEKVAEALDSFMRDYDPHEYADYYNNSDMIAKFKTMLNDRDSTKAILDELTEISNEDRFNAFDEQYKTYIYYLRSKISDILNDIPEKKTELSSQIKSAEADRDKAKIEEQEQTQEVSTP